MQDLQQTYAIIDPFCVITRRPGERVIIDGARDLAGNQLEMLLADDGVADAIEAELDLTSSVGGALSIDGKRIDLVRVHDSSVLTDGRGRYFDIQSRRPVDMHGNRVTLPQAEHNARNWAARRHRQLQRAA